MYKKDITTAVEPTLHSERQDTIQKGTKIGALGRKKKVVKNVDIWEENRVYVLDSLWILIRK